MPLTYISQEAESKEMFDEPHIRVEYSFLLRLEECTASYIMAVAAQNERLRTTTSSHVSFVLPTSESLSMATHFSTRDPIARIIANTETRNQGPQRPFYLLQMPAFFTHQLSLTASWLNLDHVHLVQFVNFQPKCPGNSTAETSPIQ